MRVIIRLLGRELLDVAIGDQADVDAVEHGVPFGFSGGAGGQLERADDWLPAED